MTPAHDMKMKVIHALATIKATIDYDAISVRKPFLMGHPACHKQKVPGQFRTQFPIQ